MLVRSYPNLKSGIFLIEPSLTLSKEGQPHPASNLSGKGSLEYIGDNEESNPPYFLLASRLNNF